MNPWEYLSRLGWPILWLLCGLSFVAAWYDHGELSERIKVEAGKRRARAIRKRLLLWSVPVIAAIAAIIAQIGADVDENKIALLESKSGPRTITEKQEKVIISELKNSDGLVHFIVNRNAPDAMVFSESLASTLSKAGFGIIPTWGSSTEIAPDVSVESDDIQETKKIKDALRDAHIQINNGRAFSGGMMADVRVASGTIKIYVGVKSMDGN